jgi:serine/threonine protein kinase
MYNCTWTFLPSQGLAYFHKESSTQIIHRDIKANNAPLETSLNTKITYFGLTKLYDEKKT